MPEPGRRRGQLRNGGRAAPVALANAVPRCEARSKRTGERCLAPATRWAWRVLGRRLCQHHGGGRGSGQVTREGMERIRRAQWKHGYFTRANVEQRSMIYEDRKRLGIPTRASWKLNPQPRDARGRFCR